MDDATLSRIEGDAAAEAAPAIADRSHFLTERAAVVGTIQADAHDFRHSRDRFLLLRIVYADDFLQMRTARACGIIRLRRARPIAKAHVES